MGKGANKTQREQAAVNLSVDEIKAYTKIFNALDYDAKGYVTISDIKKTLEVKIYVIAYYTDNIARFLFDTWFKTIV